MLYHFWDVVKGWAVSALLGNRNAWTPHPLFSGDYRGEAQVSIFYN
jgi:hypothetical protein